MANYQRKGYDYDSINDVLENPSLFVKDRRMAEIAIQAASILRNFQDLEIPAIQHKGGATLNTCWCVGFKTARDCKESIFNFTITPPNLKVEFRRPKVLDLDDFDQMKWQQKGIIPYIPLFDNDKNNKSKIVEMMSKYIESVRSKEFKIGGTSASEKMIEKSLRKIFPENQIIANHRPDDLRSDKNKPLELDLYLPEIRLAIEVQGPPHYGEKMHHGQDATDRLRTNDQRKINWCQEKEIKLIWINWRGFNSDLSIMKSKERIDYLRKLLNDFLKSETPFLHWRNL